MESFDSLMAAEWTKCASEYPDLPGIEGIVEFFRKRQRSMKVTSVSLTPVKSTYAKPAMPSRSVHQVSSQRFNCLACDHPGHAISRCSKFHSLHVNKRQKIV